MRPSSNPFGLAKFCRAYGAVEDIMPTTLKLGPKARFVHSEINRQLRRVALALSWILGKSFATLFLTPALP